jgi:hypothetical protein
VKRHRIGIRFDALIERFKRRRDCTALPVGFRMFDNLAIGKALGIIGVHDDGSSEELNQAECSYDA